MNLKETVMNYKEFKEIKEAQNKKVDILSDQLNSFPKESNGMVIESIRLSDDYRKLKHQYSKEWKAYQNINKVGVKLFKKEIREDALAKRFRNTKK